MKYLHFYNLKLSLIALGCDHYGESISEEIALKQLDIFADAGGNLLDTAHIYGQEKAGTLSSSELVLGKWMQELVHERRWLLHQRAVIHTRKICTEAESTELT